jgi:hypothetical protein
MLADPQCCTSKLISDCQLIKANRNILFMKSTSPPQKRATRLRYLPVTRSGADRGPQLRYQRHTHD